MPAFKRGSTAAEYLAPGVLVRDPTWHTIYYVDPIAPAWPAERVESYPRGQNYLVQLVAAHEAYLAVKFLRDYVLGPGSERPSGSSARVDNDATVA